MPFRPVPLRGRGPCTTAVSQTIGIVGLPKDVTRSLSRRFTRCGRGRIRKSACHFGRPGAHAYDSIGRILTRKLSTDTNPTVFEWDGWDLVREVAPDGVETVYCAPEGETLSFKRGSNVYQLHADALGSTKKLTAKVDMVVGKESVFDAWGHLIRSSTTSDLNSQAFKLAGTWGVRNDGDTELQYMRARWYSPQTAGFLSRDAARQLHRYQYARNSPTEYIDPSGLKEESVTGRKKFVVEKGIEYLRGVQKDCYPKDGSLTIIANNIEGLLTKNILRSDDAACSEADAQAITDWSNPKDNKILIGRSFDHLTDYLYSFEMVEQEMANKRTNTPRIFRSITSPFGRELDRTGFSSGDNNWLTIVNGISTLYHEYQHWNRHRNNKLSKKEKENDAWNASLRFLRRLKDCEKQRGNTRNAFLIHVLGVYLQGEAKPFNVDIIFTPTNL